MQPPFDIAADLDTPVSTYLKLAALQPRYLLESVEGGANLGRYSFLGFGDAVELRLDAGGASRTGLAAKKEELPRPAGRDQLLDLLRDTLAGAPRLAPAVPDLPFAGGLVGTAGYDLVRYFERLPNPPSNPKNPTTPEAAYVATTSLLVFDHLTRRIALLHAGSDAERASLRTEIMRLLRGALPERPPPGGHMPAAQSLSADEYMNAVRRARITSRAATSPARPVGAVQRRHDISPFETYRALRLVNPRPTCFLRSRRRADRRFLARGTGEAAAGRGLARPIAGTGRAARRSPKTRPTSVPCSPTRRRTPSTSCCRSRPQRPGTRRHRRLGAREPLPLHRALQRHASSAG